MTQAELRPGPASVACAECILTALSCGSVGFSSFGQERSRMLGSSEDSGLQKAAGATFEHLRPQPMPKSCQGWDSDPGPLRGGCGMTVLLFFRLELRRVC